MKTILKYAQLPFQFSEKLLVDELNSLDEQWMLHYNKAHYEGDWCALPLRSLGGKIDNVLPENKNGIAFMDSPLMDKCPYIKSITQLFPCQHNAIRLLNLKAGAIIKEHRDADLNYENNEARIHIPITTNPDVEFYLDNERMTVLPGECWYMNFNLPHRITNAGSTDRVHLVMDIILNDAVRELFSKSDPGKTKYIKAKPAFDVATRKVIINTLLDQNTPTSLQLAKEMEAELYE